MAKIQLRTLLFNNYETHPTTTFHSIEHLQLVSARVASVVVKMPASTVYLLDGEHLRNERFCSIDANEVQDVVDPPICNCFGNFLSEDLFAQHLLHNLSFPLLVHCRGGNIKSRLSIFKTSHLLPPGFPKELPPPMDTFPGSPLSDKNEWKMASIPGLLLKQVIDILILHKELIRQQNLF